MNVIMIGPDKCGKTTVSNYLAQEHQRSLVRLDQLFDYALKRDLPVMEKAQKFLEEKAEQLKKDQDELEKRKKKKKNDKAL